MKQETSDMARRHISEEDKRRLIDAYDEGRSYQEVADVLGIKRGTAYHVIRRFKNTGVVARMRGGRNHQLVDEEMEDAVVSIVEQHPEFTLAQINHELRLRLPDKPHVCDNTVSNVLHGRLITTKLLRDVPVQRNSPRVKTARHEMADWLLANAQTEKVFIDESGFHLWLKRSYGRSVRGARAFRQIDARGSPHMSIIFAVSSTHGLVRHDMREGGYRSQHFNAFLTSCSQQLDRNVVFIYDNAPSHLRAHEAHLRENHLLRNQPPHSPFFNICEGAFSVWKASLKRMMAEVRDQLLDQPHQQRMATMAQLADQSTAAVTVEIAHNLYDRILNVLPTCIREEDIHVF